MLRLRLGIFSRLFSGTKFLRQQDVLTQSQIDDILGNNIQEHQQQKVQNSLQQQQQKGLIGQLFYNLLPIKNQVFPVVQDPDFVQIQQTPNQNIFEMLNLPSTVSYKQYTKALSYFRTQTELYGDEQQVSQIDVDKLEFKELLSPQSKYIKLSKERHMINLSIPGTIQVEDPRNFMELRPIEQFRNTPLVPIADSAMKKHKEMLQQYHRRQFIFEVSKQSIANTVLVLVAVGVCSYMIYLVIRKQQERTVAYARLKHKRVMGQKGDAGFRI